MSQKNEITSLFTIRWERDLATEGTEITEEKICDSCFQFLISAPSETSVAKPAFFQMNRYRGNSYDINIR